MQFTPYLLIAATAYLLGSIPFGYILVRMFRKEDIREKGSGNIGATNVVRSGAKGLGALTFLLDALKGYVAVVAGRWIMMRFDATSTGLGHAAALAALCALIGHIWTVWLGFKGGKGVATAFGLFVALAPWAAWLSLATFILVVAVTRYVSLASIAGAFFIPVYALLLPHGQRSPWVLAMLFVIPAVVILKHHQNIARLLHGTEYRFGGSKASGA
ncbi:glycerol-3-phosphate 1-O-acyltransferase PlsY [Acidipila rosea]|uniref:Glycerol-3-phosphate acyltransferase n=1 Tax=Acidipila rosea TaxID=768535 RepID=A0A4R1LA11_9BACT|nr:glycerol-3-phosphate 1-O-acyltransferase PlsY [Acidipila rosea]TCK75185.1 acyl-phosphate glycerol-3-phosphate acyltransferase [Acidipila rosea]